MKTVRVSLGSAAKLGLKKMRIDCLPTTIYVMTPGVCRAKCLFCAQWVTHDRLSRVRWPEYLLEDVISRIGTERVCIQCLNYESVFSDVLNLLDQLKGNPISLSAQPFSEEEIHQLKNKIERISLNLDCATPELFEKIKPFYTWDNHLRRLLYAREVFGPFRVSSHLIVGLGETEQELVETMKFLYTHEISSSLFAFTPVRGTPLEKKKKPPIRYYRRMQAAHYLIYTGEGTFEYENQRIANFNVTVPPEAFTTRGCPGCNRPYYTESPRNLYNFPYMPTDRDMAVIKEQLK